MILLSKTYSFKFNIYRVWTFTHRCQTDSDLHHSYGYFFYRVSPDTIVPFLSVILMNINSISVSVANRINIIFVVCKVFTMVIVIITGLVRIGQGFVFMKQKLFIYSCLLQVIHNIYKLDLLVRDQSDRNRSKSFLRIFLGTTKNPFGVALAFYSGLWAYDGWNSLNSVTEELKNPKRYR